MFRKKIRFIVGRENDKGRANDYGREREKCVREREREEKDIDIKTGEM